jgi:ferredoxin-NADP reductase
MVYGARSAAAMVFHDELRQLGGGRVEFVAQDTGGLSDLESILDAAPDGTAVYCCGPAPMISRVEELCASRRKRLSLHVERFGGAGSIAEPDGSDLPFDLVLAETGVTSLIFCRLQLGFGGLSRLQGRWHGQRISADSHVSPPCTMWPERRLRLI